MSKANASVSGATTTRRGEFPDDIKQDAVRLVVEVLVARQPLPLHVGVVGLVLRKRK